MNTTAKQTAYYLVQTNDWCWGKGTTLEIAIKAARAEGSRVTKTGKAVDYVIYEFSDEILPDTLFVDQMGSTRWEVTAEAAAEEDRTFDKGLIATYMVEKGKRRPLGKAKRRSEQ